MQDIRIRTGAATLLSVVAFFSLTGAVAAFLWWLVFARKTGIFSRGILLPSVMVIGVFSLILEITSGGGISYFIRMLVIILIGAWLLAEQEPGDLSCMGVWLLGNRIGFELGMIAEMSLQSLESLKTDIGHIRVASRLKGCGWGVHSIIPAGRVLVHRTLNRAEETAEILAVRGYTYGGTRAPVFTTTAMDILGGCSALCVAIIAIFPVSEFFILYG